MRGSIWVWFVASLIICIPQLTAMGQDVGTCAPSTADAYLDVNNVRARIPNNGGLFWHGAPDVYEVPQGSGITAIFLANIWIGGMIADELRVSGSTFSNYEFWSGPLNDDGSAPADCKPWDRVWKISKADIIRYQTEGIATSDLLDWPTGLGAPTLNAEGISIDLTDRPLHSRVDRKINLEQGEIPDIEGDQMLWWIMNDKGNDHEFSKTPALGLEVHVSAFAFNAEGAVGSTTFYRYRIKHKGTEPLTSTYLGIFSLTDLGADYDDYVGSDSTLGLGYAYNAFNNDDDYGLAPPAIGYDLLQGAVVGSNGLDDDHDGIIDEPGERLSMTAFLKIGNSGAAIQMLPDSGADMYNYMQAQWKDGSPVTIGGSGLGFSRVSTSFMYPGDPPEFWSEINDDSMCCDNYWTPENRSFVMSSGPFEINPSQEQEIVFGIITSFGANHLDSVRQLKEDSQAVQESFDGGFENVIPYSVPAPLETATLVAPSDNTSSHPPSVRFLWEGVLRPGEMLWKIQYAENPDFESATLVTTTDNFIELPLEADKTYWWRVARQGPHNNLGPWSPSWKLSTGESISGTVTAIQIVANAAGPVDPPGMAAYAFNNSGFPLVNGFDRPQIGQQSTNSSLWGVHTFREAPQDVSFETFLSRTIRAGWDKVLGFDFEVRFTEACRLAWEKPMLQGKSSVEFPVEDGCYGYNRFFDGWSLQALPFEVWRTEIDSDGNSTGVRLIVASFDQEGDGWAIRNVDHPVSGGNDDPQTDWSYWYVPNDLTPGQAGYKAWLKKLVDSYRDSSGSIREEAAKDHGAETFGRITFVALNEGSVEEGERPYSRLTIPEIGTVLQIVTNKPSTPVLSAPPINSVRNSGNARFYWTTNRDIFNLQFRNGTDIIREIENAQPGDLIASLPTGTYTWRVGSDYFGWSEEWTVHIASGVANKSSDQLPTELALDANYPNPFNPTTQIQFRLPNSAKVDLTVYDMLGRRIITLVGGIHYSVGTHRVEFNGSNLPSGQYVYRLTADGQMISGMMTLLR